MLVDTDTGGRIHGRETYTRISEERCGWGRLDFIRQMEEEFLISIIVPLYNRVEIVGETLSSIANQTYRHWECLVVDDGSDDKSVLAAERFPARDPRFAVYKRPKERIKGANACRNYGIEHSKGDLVIFLDSDDILCPGALQGRADVMNKNSDLDFSVFASRLFIRKSGDTDLLWNKPSDSDDLDRFLSLDIPWHTCGVIWRKNALVKLTGWNERLLSFQDWDIHFRALAADLKYKKYLVVDNHVRLPHESSLGKVSTSPNHLHSHERLFGGVRDRLRKANKLTEERDMSIVGLHYYLAKQWGKKGSCVNSVRVWNRCQKMGLITRSQFIEGVIFFVTYRILIIRVALRAYLNLRWPNDMVTEKMSDTLRNTPLSTMRRA
ncbi:MAG: glycosyltransferase family 2 protein [Gammaproteobacteria bacterium]|nr:glycosyltransferase family 2 protein [Gammaproteobacteria bacterium]